jgi:outer membrane protein assembly factor BamB
VDLRELTIMVWFVIYRTEAIVVSGWVLLALAAFAPSWDQLPEVEPQVLWHVAGEGRGTAAVHGTTVYFLSKRHDVAAIDGPTGRVRWTRSTRAAGESTAGSALVALASAVIAGDDDVVCFGVDGAERWRFAPVEAGAPGTYLGPAVGGLVFAGSRSGQVYAVEIASGRQRWAARIADDDETTVFAPVVSDRLVIAGFTSFAPPTIGGFVALDAATGDERWRQLFPSSTGTSTGTGVTGGPLLVGDVVVGVNRTGVIYAFDLNTGSVRWSLPAVNATAAGSWRMDQDFRALARTGPLLFAGSLTGVVAAYDINTRTERWRRAPLEASVAFGITSDEQAVYVPYFSGHLVALDVKSGVERWRTSDGRRGFSWAPLSSGTHLYAAASGAGYFAFRP